MEVSAPERRLIYSMLRSVVFVVLWTLTHSVDAAAAPVGTPCDGEIVRFRRNYTAFAEHTIGALKRARIGDRLSLVKGGLPCAASDRGLWLEFGVFTGTSIQIIAKFRRDHSSLGEAARVHGFDSFRGLPESWRGVYRPAGGSGVRLAASLERGNFALGGQPPQLGAHVSSYIEWVVGWYNESLPQFLQQHPDEKVTFLHLDADLYSSTKTIFDLLTPRIEIGTVLVFDELYNYPEYQQHELLAFWEFLRDNRQYSAKLVSTATRQIHSRPRVENFIQSCAFVLVPSDHGSARGRVSFI